MPLPDPAETASLETEEQCVSYLEALRWPDGVCCPNCGNQKISRFQAKGKSGKTRQICQCLDRACKYQFSVTTGTIFHDSHLPLSKWFEAMSLLGDPAAQTSVNQLRFVLGVQYKTAKNVAERIQRALQAGTIETAPAPAAPLPQQEVVPETVAASVSRAARPAAPPTAEKNISPARPAVRRPSAPEKRPPAAPTNVPPQTTPSTQPTVVDSMLSVFTTAMNLSVKPPLAAVNYLKKKILDQG